MVGRRMFAPAAKRLAAGHFESGAWQTTNRATLMEEVAHVFLGHTPNRLAVVTSPDSLQKKEANGKKIVARDYNHDDEEAAYAIGAAALVPYAPLRRRVMKGSS